MSYTLTFDASHKVKTGGSHVKGFLRHVGRDADERQGIKHRHSNKNLDAGRTHLNETLIGDGSGGFSPAKSSRQLEEALNARLEAVEGKLRKDAVVMRPFILQIDPDWYDEHCPNWRDGELTEEAKKLHEAMLSWAVFKYGAENIIGASLHLDEYNPQLHVIFTPVTADGRLSQKDFFKGPSDLKQVHDEFRKYMRDAGLDVDMTRTRRSTEHLSSAEFQKKADRITAEAEELFIEMNALDQVVERTVADLARQQTELDEEVDELIAERQKAAQERQEAAASLLQAEQVKQSAEALQARLRADYEDKKAELQKRYDDEFAELEARNEKASKYIDFLATVPQESERFLDMPVPGQQVSVREYLEERVPENTEKRKEQLKKITQIEAAESAPSLDGGNDGSHGGPGIPK